MITTLLVSVLFPILFKILVSKSERTISIVGLIQSIALSVLVLFPNLPLSSHFSIFFIEFLILYSISFLELFQQRNDIFKTPHVISFGWGVSLIFWGVIYNISSLFELSEIDIFLFEMVVLNLCWIYLMLPKGVSENTVFDANPQKLVFTSRKTLVYLLFSYIVLAIISSLIFRNPYLFGQSIYSYSYVLSGIMILIINLKKLRTGIGPYFLGSVAFTFVSVILFYFGNKYYFIFTIISYFMILDFIFILMGNHLNGHDFDFLVYFLLSFSLFIFPIVGKMFFIEITYFSIISNFLLIIATVFFFTVTRKNPFLHNVDLIGIKSEDLRIGTSSFEFTNNFSEEDKKLELLSELFEQMVRGDVKYVNLSDKKKAILFKNKDIEVTIFTNEFKKFHKNLAKQLVKTVRNFQQEDVSPENFSEKKLEILKQRILDDITNKTVRNEPRFII